MSDYSLCDFSLKQLKDIAKDFKIPTTKIKKCDLIILLDRAGYAKDYIYVPPRKTKFQKKKKQMEYEEEASIGADKLKYKLCVDRRNKLYSLSKNQLHQKIKKRNPNFTIPEHLTQQQIIDELMYLDECNDLLPNNFSSKLEFIQEKTYMKPINEPAQFRLGSDESPVQPKSKPTPKTQSKTKNTFLDNRMEAMRLERLPVRDLLEILYSKQYYPMEIINKLKTKEQLINAIMSSDPSNISSIVSKL